MFGEHDAQDFADLLAECSGRQVCDTFIQTRSADEPGWTEVSIRGERDTMMDYRVDEEGHVEGVAVRHQFDDSALVGGSATIRLTQRTDEPPQGVLRRLDATVNAQAIVRAKFNQPGYDNPRPAPERYAVRIDDVGDNVVTVTFVAPRSSQPNVSVELSRDGGAPAVQRVSVHLPYTVVGQVSVHDGDEQNQILASIERNIGSHPDVDATGLLQQIVASADT